MLNKEYYLKNRKVLLKKAKDYYYKNRDKKLKYQKEYGKNHKSEIKKKTDLWRIENPEKFKKQHQGDAKKYRKRHPEKHKESVKKWHRKHPENSRVSNRKRRARKAGAQGIHTSKQIEFLRNISGGFCPGYNRDPHYVGFETLTVDHTIPLSKGGSDYIENIQMMCKPCNSSKGVST